jgi:thiamine biosynthesis protein ThiS
MSTTFQQRDGRERGGEGREGARSARRLSISVNGEPTEVETGSSIRRLLDDLGLADRRVAVAVNRDVVRRSDYEGTLIGEGDRVEILEAVGGG